MSKYNSTELNTSDAESWLFNVDELDAFQLDAPQKAKSAVSQSEDIPYRKLRARLVNAKRWGDTFVVVVRVYD